MRQGPTLARFGITGKLRLDREQTSEDQPMKFPAWYLRTAGAALRRDRSPRDDQVRNRGKTPSFAAEHPTPSDPRCNLQGKGGSTCPDSIGAGAWTDAAADGTA